MYVFCYLHDFLPRTDNRAAGGVVYYRQFKISESYKYYTADDLYVITIIIIPYGYYDEACLDLHTTSIIRRER